VTTVEGDEPPEAAEDNSLGRLLALSDGIFAIAMTLLALDLKLPELGGHVTDGELRHALADNWRAYLSFIISFRVAGTYWSVHRRTMRSVTTLDSRMVRRTLSVLLLVAALPFPASVLATYGSEPSALAFYAAYNLLLNLAVLRLLAHDRIQAAARGNDEPLRLIGDVVVFALCIPLAYVLEDNAPFLLFLLVVSGRLPALRRGLTS
jgi:uncharacterized membrane protein